MKFTMLYQNKMLCCLSRKNHDINMSHSNLLPTCAQVKVIKVLSSSTVIVAIKIQKRTYGFKIHLFGVNSLNIKTSALDQKQRAIQARAYLHSLIHDKKVDVQWVCNNEYIVRYNQHDINVMMCFAKPPLDIRLAKYWKPICQSLGAKTAPPYDIFF